MKKKRQAPVVLEDFENGLDRYLPSAGEQCNEVRISIEEDEELVRFGKCSLKLEYDFTGMTGISGAYLRTKGGASNIPVPGYPEKISMWVYGDGKKHWLRMQMLDAKGAVPLDLVDEHAGVDWIGWRYLEVEVPKGRTLPFSIHMPVRYIETSDEKKDSGVIYIDQIRALYGPNEDDVEPPVISGLTPSENSEVETNQPFISVHAEHAGDDSEGRFRGTGVHRDSIRMSVDGMLVQHTLSAPDGVICYQPEEALADGLHRVSISVQDHAGNRTNHSWTFTVNTGSPRLIYESPEHLYAGNTYALTIKGMKTAEIIGGQMEFAFDPAKVEHFRVERGRKMDSTRLQVDANNDKGTVTLTLNDLNVSDISDDDMLGRIWYDVKTDAEGTNTIELRSGSIVVTKDRRQSLSFSGHTITSGIKHGLSLEWNEHGNVHGYETVLEVTDSAGHPVHAARLHADGQYIGATDEEGRVITRALTLEVRSVRLQAVKDGAEAKCFSPLKIFSVSPLSGSPEPYSINVSMGLDPMTSRGFTWQTDPGTEETVIVLVRRSDFSGFHQTNLIRIKGTSELYQTLDLGTVRVHKASVTGLEPGTLYVYRVGDGKKYYSPHGMFHTAPRSGESTSFLYFADSQAYSEASFKLWGSIVKRAFAETPDAEFMIQVGDMVDKGFTEQEWKWWFHEVQEVLLRTTLIAAIGNHEVMGHSQNKHFLMHFNQPGNGPSDLQGSCFSFDYKNIHFIVLNSECRYEEQRQWLERDLVSTDQTWKIAIFHRGPYGSVYDTEVVRRLWAPVLEKNKVDLVLNGHDHIYLRTHSMLNNRIVHEGEGTTYVIAGTSGPKFYPLTSKYWQLVTDEERTQMYAAVRIEGNRLKFTARTVSGRVVDEFTLTK